MPVVDKGLGIKACVHATLGLGPGPGAASTMSSWRQQERARTVSTVMNRRDPNALERGYIGCYDGRKFIPG